MVQINSTKVPIYSTKGTAKGTAKNTAEVTDNGRDNGPSQCF